MEPRNAEKRPRFVTFFLSPLALVRASPLKKLAWGFAANFLRSDAFASSPPRYRDSDRYLAKPLAMYTRVYTVAVESGEVIRERERESERSEEVDSGEGK